MTEHRGSRGFAGAVLKLMRAGDYRLTVTGRREISPHYLRLSLTAGGTLAEQAVKSAAFDARDHFGWVGCGSRTTRSLTKVLQKDFGIPWKSIAAQAYWMVGRSME